MSFKGRYILGSRVPLSVRTYSATRVPTEPAQAPVAVVSSDTALVVSVRMPIVDRYTLTGWFQYSLFLDTKFTTGAYRVVYYYDVGGVSHADAESFEVVAGGQADGPGLAMMFYRRPTSDFVLLQTDGGRILRRRNPRL